MKKLLNVILVICVTLLTMGFIGCPKVPKVKVPAPEIEIPAPVTPKIVEHLYLTTDKDQMSGVPRDRKSLAVGESVVVYARGCDPDGRWFELPADVVVNWEADRELEVTPKTGHVVTIKCVKKIDIAATVNVIATRPDGKKVDAIFTVTPKK